MKVSSASIYSAQPFLLCQHCHPGIVSLAFHFLLCLLYFNFLLLAPNFPLGSPLLLTQIFLFYSSKALMLHHLACHFQASSSLFLQGSPSQFFSYFLGFRLTLFSFSFGFVSFLFNKLFFNKLHLFQKNCCLSPACTLCDAPVEDPKHYFLYCPSFAALRKNLFTSTALLLGNRCHCASDMKKIDWFLNGISHVDFDTNVMLFQYVQSFISLSNRFC